MPEDSKKADVDFVPHRLFSVSTATLIGEQAHSSRRKTTPWLGIARFIRLKRIEVKQRHVGKAGMSR